MGALIGATLVGGLASTWLGLLADPPRLAETWPAVLLFAAATVLAQSLSSTIGERNKTSVAIVPILSAGLVAGEVGIAVSALAFVIYNKLEKRSPIQRALFNLGMVLLAAEAGRWSFALLAPGRVGQAPFEWLLLPALVMGLVYYAVNHLPLSLVRALAERRGPVDVWMSDYRWLWPHYLVLGVLAVIVAAGYAVFGWSGALALMAPVAMMHLAITQYAEHTAANLREVQALNRQLEDEIAQRQAAEEENARLAHDAARAAALAELNRLKSEFISVASHELRTPLTAVMGYSELLLADASTTPAVRRGWLEIVNRSAQQLSSLVDNLLDVSRIEMGRMKVEASTVELDRAIETVLESVRGSTSVHTFQVDLAGDARLVHADFEKLRQILANLVGNAVKYSPEGGPIAISSRRDAVGDVVVSVSDRGIGIPKEYFERIFDRFQRVDSSTTRAIRGTGLGLFIVRELLELHGGSIRLESEVGRGSTFHATLKAARVEAGQKAVFGVDR